MAATAQNLAGDVPAAYGELICANAEAISRFGGRLAVLYKFVDAVLPQLNTVQRREAVSRFRQGIEEVMSLTDDTEMPAEYHAALLEQVNVLLSALEARGNPSR